MTTLREFVARRLDELGRNPFEAARIADLERTFVRDILIERKMTVLGRNIDKLALALDTTPEAITAAMGGSERPSEPAKANREVIPAATAVPDPAAMARDLPVYGAASGAAVSTTGKGGRKIEGFVLDRSAAVDMKRRPPALSGAKDAYAIYVVGDSMKPQHEAGDLRIVHPHRPVRPGDTALILVRPGEDRPVEAYIKRFAGRTAKTVVAEQLNPRAVVEFRAETVIAVHKVLTVAEMLEG